MRYPTYSRLGSLLSLIDLFEALAIESIRASKKACQRPCRRKRGSALQTGPHTPLWNELVKQVSPLLRKRGDKAKLARVLGLTRQRIHKLFVSRTACADAERTLMLLGWLHAKSKDRDPS